MTPQQIIGLAVRLFAVWLAVTSVPYFVAIPSAIASSTVESGNALLLSYALAIAYLAAAVILWGTCKPLRSVGQR